MVKFRQLIRPGEHGRDVLAVKDGMRRMHVPGSGGLGKTNFAGKQFVHCIRVVQRNHGIHVDGIYGRKTHNIIAPHFSAWDRLRYRRAKARHHHKPPTPPGDAIAAAKMLIQYYHEGKFHDDRGSIMVQLEQTALGNPVWSQAGYYVHIDQRLLKGLVWMIQEGGFKIGLYALCSDHFFDGTLGHAGGKAADISSINGVAVAQFSAVARENTLKAAIALHRNLPAPSHPWQLICGGYGYTHDSAIAAQTIPSQGFYGAQTMSEHENHIHYGVLL